MILPRGPCREDGLYRKTFLDHHLPRGSSQLHPPRIPTIGNKNSHRSSRNYLERLKRGPRQITSHLTDTPCLAQRPTYGNYRRSLSGLTLDTRSHPSKPTLRMQRSVPFLVRRGLQLFTKTFSPSYLSLTDDGDDGDDLNIPIMIESRTNTECLMGIRKSSPSSPPDF